MTEHLLVRDDPDRSGFRIVDDYHYVTRGHVFWTPEHQELYVSVIHGGFTNISGSMKLQKACGWLESKGIELAHDHGFILSGYIIACEQRTSVRPACVLCADGYAHEHCDPDTAEKLCEACSDTGSDCIGHWYKTEAGEWIKR